ncbi:MAG: hypothetical protein HOO06_05080 [Bdellovibrionaceae bacterium]|jgi:hypothetical protein|nr:hypothetical protein [Pseudobdellovibrionaceae bacterium]
MKFVKIIPLLILLTSCHSKDLETENKQDAVKDKIESETNQNNTKDKIEKSTPKKQSKRTQTNSFSFHKNLTVFEGKVSYLLKFEALQVELKPDEVSGMLKPINSDISIPKEINRQIQLIYLLNDQYPANISLESIINMLNIGNQDFYSTNISTIIHNTCYQQKNTPCLEELLEFVENDRSKINLDFKNNLDEINFLASDVITSLAMLTDNWEEARSLFASALTLENKNQRTQEQARLFSIKIAIKVLEFYEQEISTNGLNTAISFTLENGEFDFVDSLIEVTANTYNVLRLITSLFGDRFAQDISDRWIASLSQVRQYKTELKEVLHSYQDGTKSFQELLGHNLAQTPFGKHLVQHYIYPIDTEHDINFPAIELFEIDNINEFTNPQIAQVLLGQLNFLNVYMLLRGPAIIQAFGKTAIGTTIVDKLKLKAIVDRFSRLRPPLNNIMVVAALETADGCIPRYIYVIYTVGDTISGDDKKKLEAILSSTQKNKQLIVR